VKLALLYRRPAPPLTTIVLAFPLDSTVRSKMAQALRIDARVQAKRVRHDAVRQAGPAARKSTVCRGFVEDMLKPLTSMGQV
jgi:hypothetical protein